MSGYAYTGSELELFARATNWKSYLAACIGSHLGDEVLEVGAGLGATPASSVRDRTGAGSVWSRTPS